MARLLFPVLGFSSFLFQLIIIRETLSGFHGNEFFIALVFFGWFFWTALGSSFAGRAPGKMENSARWTVLSWALLCLLMPTLVVGARKFKAVFFLPGETPDLLLSSASVLLMTSPVCFVLGLQFVLFLKELDKDGKPAEISGAYALENAGFFAAGLLYYFFLARLDSFASLGVIILANLAAAAFFMKAKKILTFGNVLMFLFILAGSLPMFVPQLRIKMDLQTSAPAFRPQRLKEIIYTETGALAAAETAGQRNFYYNGAFAGHSGEDPGSEISAHLPMFFAASAEKLFLAGTGFNGLALELAKYSPGKLFFAPLDPRLPGPAAAYMKEFLPPEAEIIKEDPAGFLKKSGEAYDAVILDLPPPSSLAMNRYYSREFFEAVKKRLKPGGIVSISAPYAPDRPAESLKKLNVSLYRTLKAVFPEVLALPDERNVFIASSVKIDLPPAALAERFRKRKVKTYFFGEKYALYRLNGDRRAEFLRFADGEKGIAVNGDLNPKAYFYETARWAETAHPGFSKFLMKRGFSLFLAFLFPAAALFLLVKTFGKKTPLLSLWLLSFSLMAAEVLLIYLFQVKFGDAHYKISLIVSVLMLSVSAGALAFPRGKPVSPGLLNKTHALFSVYFFVLLASPGSLPQAGFFLLAAAGGALFGFAFSAAGESLSGQKRENAGGILYSSDLLGALAGCVLPVVFFIPLYGAAGTLIFLAALNFFMALKSPREA